MALTIPVAAASGRNLFATLERLSDGHRWDHQLSQWAPAPGLLSEKIPLPEGAGYEAGSYTATVTGLGSPGEVQVRVHDDDAADVTILTGIVNVQDDSEASGVSAAEVWAYASRTLTQSAAQVAQAVEGDNITVKRGDDLVIALTDIGSLAGRTKLWFTVKRWYDDADDDAVLMIVEGVGLTRLNGAAGTAGQGSVTVTDEATGDLTVVIAAAASAQLLPRETYLWDVQALLAGGVVTRAQGAFTVVGDVTRAVS